LRLAWRKVSWDHLVIDRNLDDPDAIAALRGRLAILRASFVHLSG
jgi:hypothetical protein